jgi:ABC-2 type transport system permease protein
LAPCSAVTIAFRFRVAVINESQTEFAAKFTEEVKNNDVFEVEEGATTLDEAKEKMNRGQLEATIILPSTFGEIDPVKKYPTGQATVLYDQSNETAGRTLGTVLQDVFAEVNKQFVEPAAEPFTVKTESTATKGLTQFDYTFSGILGFTLLSLGIFGPTTVFPRLKQRGVLRRYHMTTLKVWQYFTGNVISNSIVGLLALILMYSTAVLFFDLNMRGSYINLAFVVLLGTIMLFGIGLALGGWAKNENQAAPLAQLVTLPMMFLSGVFFPTFLMPELLQAITKFIPLTAVIDSIRLVITENASLIDLAPQIGIMAAWTLIIYIIAFHVFRWE